MEFKDRSKELEALRERLESPRFELVIIYGRRRVGKTELVLQATKNARRIYYLCVGNGNLQRFHDACSKVVPRARVLKSDYELLLDAVKDEVDVVVIDEFQELIKEDEKVLSVLQSVIDQQLQASRLKLVFMGSSISLMQSKVLSYKAPLYGRRTASLKLLPVRFFDLAAFFPGATLEELVEIHGFAGGVPQYLVQVQRPFWAWLAHAFHEEIGFLRDEMEFLLRYEFSNPSTYKAVLEAIAFGNTTVGDIKNRMKVARTDISPYLDTLASIGFIHRQVPVTENLTTRSGRYYIQDFFVKFWFRFVYPNLSALESRAFNPDSIKAEYNTYLGAVFEEASMHFIIESGDVSFSKLGRWWWRDHEIDIVALDEPGGTILCAECKWRHGVDPVPVARALIQKAVHVDWRKEHRTERYWIFARSFSRKITEVDGVPVRCIDAAEMSGCFRPG